MKTWAGDGFDYVVQSGGSLGRRLENAFSQQFARGAGKVIIVASDVPDISSSVMIEAPKSLDDHEIVVGPCYDGGYYLIGMTRLHREVFDGVPWGTSQVYARTLANINKLDISLYQLRCLNDIDTENDLNQWSKTIITMESHPLGSLVDWLRHRWS
jgi:rSAM/selenodomain-associated transferase 1